MAQPFNNLLVLDVGEKRIGVARINAIALLPEPLITLQNDDNFVTNLQNLISEYNIDLIVAGLPRNSQGVETAQSAWARQFVAEKVIPNVSVPVELQDETLSTVAASEHDPKLIAKFGIDSLAALEILKDYLRM